MKYKLFRKEKKQVNGSFFPFCTYEKINNIKKKQQQHFKPYH